MFYTRIHGNLGLNKLVGLRHFFLSFLSEFILLKGKMKPSSYGLVVKFAKYAKCFEGSNKSGATFFLCANPSNERLNDLFYHNGVSLKSKKKSSFISLPSHLVYL